MAEKWISTPSRTNEILDQYGLKAKKSLGQNFLIEPQILKSMMTIGEVDKDTDVIEIGPGIGALTEFLGTYGRRVLSYELDDRMLEVLSDQLGEFDNIKIKHQDILKADLKKDVLEAFPDSKRLIVVANLPYYITTPILFELLESDLPISAYVLMMQMEVAERLTAQTGDKAYGSLSIATAYYGRATIEKKVPKTVFKPRPNVDSSILLLKRREEPLVQVKNEKAFFKLVRAAFAHRRKTLGNNLKYFFKNKREDLEEVREILDTIGIEDKRRGETLTIDEFAKMSNAFIDANLNP